MRHAVLLDLVHGCCPTCAGSSPLREAASDPCVFVLCGERHGERRHALPSWCGSAQVLDCGSTAESLFRFKQRADRMDLSSITVLTTPRGREALARYQRQLFTAVYTFEYRVKEPTCPGCTSPAHTDSPGEGVVEEEVSAFVQQLPALRGDVMVLTSTLIPDIFGHGFSTRSGGVSYIPTLSSLNLFSSSRRRDPIAVVMENRRRLAVHAGFHPEPLRLVKVDHGKVVWVVGGVEPQSYDGMVTNQTGQVLAAPGADCMTLLFADPVSKVIGVAHAGWKGTLMGVSMATVEAMVTEFGCQVSDIVVAVGPSVGSCCFTLERTNALEFISIDPDCVPDPGSDRPHVNICLANRLLLQRGGIRPEHIHDNAVTDRPCVTPCTSCQPDLFFSHVRDGLNFGTQVGFLWIKDRAELAEPGPRPAGETSPAGP
ncbi:putative laccase domain-containing protein 1 [Scophthalmus maximus]|nr:purine nucleoside phosphorylase LACC1 [Scophthalmus maximus]XP_035507140.1 purine nucleoside phosphorylase LACC1 [Scophthalmus maximus]AWP13677.1 putative laccase domain-containing protein 1 [Scophthalmus maximus]